MLKAYKIRLCPNQSQEILINKHIGACRFIYNLALEVKQEAYIKCRKTLSAFDLMKQLPDLKKECEWLKEINAQSLQNSCVNLEKAFTNFFKHGAKYPIFKNRHTGISFQIPQQTEVDFKNKKLFIPKFRKGIKAIFTKEFNGDIKTVTISRTPTGKYFASILVDNKKEFPNKVKIKAETTIGVDVGIKSFIVTSNGLNVENPKYLRNSIDRIKILQRRMRNKKKGSCNKKKAFKKIAIQHEKIANQRKDFLHKLSTKLIRENQTVAVEDLNIYGMVKNHNLAQSISDCGWSEFIRQLQYKAEWYGKNVIKIGRFEASTKICSACGTTNHNLTLADRKWLCAECGSFHDRDENAAKNIKAFALRNSGRGTSVAPVEMSAVVESAKQEYLGSISR